MIPRLYIYAGIGLAFAVLALTAYIQTKRVGSLKDRLSTVEASLTAERENLKKANEASNAYQANLRALERERDKPLSVRLCKPARVPEARAPSGSDAEASRHVSEEAPPDIGPDIGDQLLEYAIAAEANMLQLERLQGWVRAR